MAALLPVLLAHLLFICAHGATASAAATPPPLPILPVPSYAQLRWQLSEMALFLHFGPNTFTDSEWGTGHADPSVFAPPALDAGQWARVAARGGFGRVVLTAKHHDGFCLWPSALTNYSVSASPWLAGAGDVVAELAAAARAEGVGLGLYLSPWDRHEPVYGDTVAYNEHYMGQMTELLTRDRSGNMHVKELRGSGLKELSTATARAAAQNVFGKMPKRINRSSRIFPWGSADHL